MLGEDLLLDPGFGMVADPARLTRVDDRRIAVEGHDDVGVAMQDSEAGQVANGTLEARVLRAGDDYRVHVVGLCGLANRVQASVDLHVRGLRHQSLLSSPFTSAVSARFSGPSTP